MKLYLSSYKLGDKKEELREWAKTHSNRMVLIPNALDIFPDGERKDIGLQNDKQDLEDLGFSVEMLDLKNFFHNKDLLVKALEGVYSFYVVGGNVFALRKAMKLSGFDELLTQFAKSNDYLYAGYSAGICVLSKDLQVISMMDDENADPYQSGLPPIHEGIGLIEETIIPHFESDHKETELAKEAVMHCIDHDISYIALRDGEVIMKDTIIPKFSK